MIPSLYPTDPYWDDFGKTAEMLHNAQRKCEVTDTTGKHCPEQPRNTITTENGKELFVCDKCYRNIKNGAYR